jgi:hypothetical protein
MTTPRGTIESGIIGCGKTFLRTTFDEPIQLNGP